MDDFYLKGDCVLANHKSALKRARQNVVRRTRNRSNRTRVKNVVKDVRLAAKGGTENIQERLDVAQSVIDKAAKKGAIHKRTAARKVSRLTRLVNATSA
jgi:small subunit ribosomal protein S20